MNATGLAVALARMAESLKMNTLFEGIVTSGQVKQDELDWTAQLAQDRASDVGRAWTENLEGVVGEYTDLLTKHSESFQAMKESDPLGAFREAQTMLGHVSTILVKAKVKV